MSEIICPISSPILPFSLSLGNGHPLKQTCWPLVLIFHLSTILTLDYKFSYVLFYIRSQIQSSQVLIHLGHTRMNRILWAMRLHKCLLSYAFYTGNTNPPPKATHTTWIHGNILWLARQHSFSNVIQVFIHELFDIDFLNESGPQIQYWPMLYLSLRYLTLWT